MKEKSIKEQIEELQMAKSAVFGGDRKFRYMLARQWSTDLPLIAFIGLNPSTADENIDDPTIRRCVRYAKDWGFGGLMMLNLFAWRATDPKELKAASENAGIIGPQNNHWIVSIGKKVDKVVAAWGTHGTLYDRDKDVKEICKSFGIELYCLKKTKEGHPSHPLYLPKDLKPVKFTE